MFEGFSEETVRFFEKLKKNNNKDWFQSKKDLYEAHVKHPSMEFVMAMGEKLKRLSPGVQAIPKVNQSLFRINRDIRYSKNKTPYKTNLGILFWEGPRKRMECSGFYFHIGDRKLFLGVGMHIFTPDLLKKYRTAVIDKKEGPKLTRAIKSVSKKGYTIGTVHYKRISRDYDPHHVRAQYLLHNGLTAGIEEPLPEELGTPGIIDYVFLHFKNMAPIHKWLLGALK